MPKHKTQSALLSFLSQVNDPGDWDIDNLRYAGVVNFCNMITTDKVNQKLTISKAACLVYIHNLCINIITKNINFVHSIGST